MAKQTFTTGQVLTAAQMTSLQQTAMGGGSATPKTTSYVLTAADAGTVIQMNAAGATTITVNTALFAAGDSVQIQNIGAGTCTVTAGTATVTTAGSLALSQWEGGNLYFTSTSASIFFDIVQTNAPTFVGCSLYASATQSAANATVTTALWNSENFDTDSFHSTVTNTGRITIPTGKGGKYAISSNLSWNSSSVGIRQSLIYVNGSLVRYIATAPLTGDIVSQPLSLILSLSAGDYFEIAGYQTSGGALNISGGSDKIWVDVEYLGA